MPVRRTSATAADVGGSKEFSEVVVLLVMLTSHRHVSVFIAVTAAAAAADTVEDGGTRLVRVVELEGFRRPAKG